MGHICPICHSYQPQVAVVTADYGPVKKPSDIVAIKLACGHTIGGEEYAKFLALRAEILKDAASKRAALDAETRAKLAAAWKATVKAEGE
jgi:hypothetical protein